MKPDMTTISTVGAFVLGLIAVFFALSQQIHHKLKDQYIYRGKTRPLSIPTFPIHLKGLALVVSVIIVALITLLGYLAIFIWLPRFGIAPFPGPNVLAGGSNQKQADPYRPAGTLILETSLLNNNDTHKWEEVEDSSGGSCQFTREGYRVAEQNINNYKPCHVDLPVSNFTFEAQMKIISGHCGGISLRDSPFKGNAYYYKVCQDGTYGFIRFDKFSGQPDELLSGTASIHEGLNQQNTIAIVANGSHYDFYVNKIKIDRYEDGNYGQGTFGVSASGDSTVLYTNAKVWEL